MLIRTGLGGQLSGSTGGVTASRNRYGQYLRNRTVPVNPNSSRQQIARAAFATASQLWKGLSQAQRNAWAAYADGTPVLNKLGESVILSGNAMFTRTFAYVASMGEAPQDYTNAPTVPGLCSLGQLDLNVVTLSVLNGFPLIDETPGLSASLFAVQIGPPLSAGANFPGTRFTQFGTLSAVDEGINTPATVPFGALVAGQRRPCRVTGIDNDGRLAAPIVGIITVVA